MDDTYEVDPTALLDAASVLARRTRDWTEHRASVRWPGVEECGSPVVAEAVDEVAEWYLATWARIESGLLWLADSAAVAAQEYASRESSAADSFRS